MINQMAVNDIEWKRNRIGMWMTESNYECVKCRKQTTNWEQIEHHELTTLAFKTKDNSPETLKTAKEKQ